MNESFNENCPCKNSICPRHGRCVECVKQHWNTPPEDIVACQREKAQKLYMGGQVNK